ncbi:MAG: ERF family protein [Methanobrevibacter sp.]|jgi:hypothetical protein|nr:ERF family protein [Candidatus Methanoflexus mossambicus]
MAISLLEKINKIKEAMSKIKFKKSGYNKFKGYKYMELKDFQPQLNNCCFKHEIAYNFDFANGRALIYAVNLENRDEIQEMEAPFVFERGTDKKGNPDNTKWMQDVAAGMTYFKRQLLLNFFDIMEDDVVDHDENKTRRNNNGNNNGNPVKPVNPVKASKQSKPKKFVALDTIIKELEANDENVNKFNILLRAKEKGLNDEIIARIENTLLERGIE